MISRVEELGEHSILPTSAPSKPIVDVSGDVTLARFAPGVSSEMLPPAVLVVAGGRNIAVSFLAIKALKEL